MKKSNIPLFQVDAFTNKPFSGNPAAVCLLESEMDKTRMQSIAAEMNLSETAFVRRLDKGFELRWFTPTVEVDLCGHATLATAHILWEQDWLGVDETAHFHTRSGLLVAKKTGISILLDFPAKPAVAVSAPKGLLEGIGIKDGSVYFNQMDYLVLLDDEMDIHKIQADYSSLLNIKARGFMVTATSNQTQYDFISRFFAPAAGIDEDPVTGSAHCTLAPFWAERLGKTEMIAYQASPRGGEVKVKLAKNRVLLSGDAITIFRGELYV